MKKNFEHVSFDPKSDLPSTLRKIESLWKDVKDGSLTDRDLENAVKTIAEVHDELEFLRKNLARTMPRDARFDFIDIPACYMASAAVSLYVNYGMKQETLMSAAAYAFNMFCRSGMRGHGYDADRGFLQCAEILSVSPVDEFLDGVRGRFGKFAMLWQALPKNLLTIASRPDDWSVGDEERKKAMCIFDKINSLNVKLNTGEKYYFAYGSNMDEQQMEWRCPTARLIGRGALPGYRLNFRKSGSGFYATVDADPECETPILVWAVMPEDEASLDRYEGVESDCYRKHTAEAKIGTETVSGLVYIIPEDRPEGVSEERYFNILEKAYKKFGFDIEFLYAARKNARGF